MWGDNLFGTNCLLIQALQLIHLSIRGLHVSLVPVLPCSESSNGLSVVTIYSDEFFHFLSPAYPRTGIFDPGYCAV